MPGRDTLKEEELLARQLGDFVAMAAFGAHGQGDYETGIVSRVAPRVEKVLTDAMKKRPEETGCRRHRFA